MGEDIYADLVYLVWNPNAVMFCHTGLENVTTLVQESDKRQHFFKKLCVFKI
jgi:hypothetical protein